jgi:RNA polymerase sigma-32 factor
MTTNDKKKKVKKAGLNNLPVTVENNSSKKQLPSTVASEGRDVFTYDSLTTYLRDIKKYPRLSKEEEHELAVKYVQDGDVDAAYKLIVSNLWLVVKIAREYQRAARNILDLIQEGNIGLMEAVKNFDPFRNVRFPSYAVWWIKAYIIRYVISNWRLVKIGTTQAQRKLFFNLNKEKERLEREGIYPEPKLLAHNLNVREQDVIEMEQRLSGGDVSVDTSAQDDDEVGLIGVLPSPDSNAEDIISSREREVLLQGLFNNFKSTLSERDRIIFEKRLLHEDKATLQDLSEELSVSRERIRQLENRIKDKFKEYFIEKLGTSIDDVIEIS